MPYHSVGMFIRLALFVFVLVVRRSEIYKFLVQIMLLPNKSPEPTAVGAGSSAIAVHVASRRWLSFFR